MPTPKIFILAALMLMAPMTSFSATLGNIRISMAEGDVQIRTTESGEWVLSSVNTALAEGDEVWVPEDGRLELQLNDGTYVRLDHDTALGILSTDKDSSQLYLSEGRAYVYCEGKPGNVLQFDTPQISAHARGRSAFGLDTGTDYTDVSVYKGSIEVEDQSGQTRLNAGKMLSLGQDTEAETSPLGPLDAWETWNQERNRSLLASGPSARYLPQELKTYSVELDDNGQWESTEEYGRVWIPRDAADSGWSPYRNGRWMWRDGDYVWVAYERWGWAPYHYGRWAFRPPFGWCWVPPPPKAVIWGPGFVGWVRTPDYVAWVPLAPRETYYGRGDYGPHSVNVTQVNITNIRIDHRYRNSDARNGVTVVHHDTFVGGRPPPTPFNGDEIRRKIFTKKNFVIGTPPIAPARTSFMPIVKARPVPLLPPPAFEKTRATAVKHGRPLVKKPEESVLRPGRAPVLLPVKVAPAPRQRHERVPAREKGQRDKKGDADRAQERSRKDEDPKRSQREPGRIGILPGEEKGEPLKERPGILPGEDKGVPLKERPGILPGEDKGVPLKERPRDNRSVDGPKAGSGADRNRRQERVGPPETGPRVNRESRETKPIAPETSPGMDRSRKGERPAATEEESAKGRRPKGDDRREKKGEAARDKRDFERPKIEAPREKEPDAEGPKKDKARKPKGKTKAESDDDDSKGDRGKRP